MEYVQRSEAPQHLTENKEKWTKPWIEFYRKHRDQNEQLIRQKQPRDNHWLDKDIRRLLIADFHNNCGYCGTVLPTPNNDDKTKNISKGEVDHYRYKALYPELVYEWSNLIWSCHPCNHLKGKFDDPDDHIFNPCCPTDCNFLIFNIDDGKYYVQPSHEKNEKTKQRFINTDKKTCFNSEELAEQRRNDVKSLKSSFEMLNNLYINYEPFKCRDKNDLINDLINRYAEDIETKIKQKQFYLLMKRTYQELCGQYPQVSAQIESRITDKTG